MNLKNIHQYPTGYIYIYIHPMYTIKRNTQIIIAEVCQILENL